MHTQGVPKPISLEIKVLGVGKVKNYCSKRLRCKELRAAARIETACYHSLMHTGHYLKDADQWQNDSSIWCRFVCTIIVVEIGVDQSIVVLTIAEHVARCNRVVVEMFAPRTDYHSGTYIDI